MPRLSEGARKGLLRRILRALVRGIIPLLEILECRRRLMIFFTRHFFSHASLHHTTNCLDRLFVASHSYTQHSSRTRVLCARCVKDSLACWQWCGAVVVRKSPIKSLFQTADRQRSRSYSVTQALSYRDFFHCASSYDFALTRATSSASRHSLYTALVCVYSSTLVHTSIYLKFSINNSRSSSW